jgi:hypothetical protein
VTPGTPNRSAGPAIRGYAYQFDMTTMAILAAGDDETVVVEGVEDVDVVGPASSEAIQCKYYASQSFSLSKIRKALRPMLDGFAAGKHWNYRLFAHFKDDPEKDVPTELTLPQLKQALTKQPKGKEAIHYYDGIADAELEEFLKHFEIRPGPSFEDQQQDVHEALTQALGCSPEDVTDLHYGSSVALVMGVAMRPAESDRRLTRKEFVAQLDKRPAMYTRWHHELLDHAAYLTGIRKRIKSLKLTQATSRRTVVLGPTELTTATGPASVVDLIEGLRHVGFGPGCLHTAKPWTVILDADQDTVADVKCQLIGRKVVINDGYEHLRFSPEAFDRDPLVNRGGNKVTKVAYDVRIISRATFDAHADQLGPPDVLLAFHDKPPNLDLGDATPRRLDVAGAGVEEIGKLLGAFT